MCEPGLPQSRKKVWKMMFPDQGKVGNSDISHGNLEKMGIVREFKNFPLNSMARQSSEK